MLSTLIPVNKHKETSHNQGSHYIISIKFILQPVTDSILIRTFDRRRKLLKQVKNLENLRNYKNWAAKVEVEVP